MGLLVKLVVFAIVGVAGALAARRMANAAKAPISDDECVSCGSREVQVQGEGAYVCLACGYEGGSGRAAMREQTQAERYASLTPEARQEAVTDHVRTAARILSNYNGAAALAGVAATAAGFGDLSRDEGVDSKQSAVADDLCAAAAELKRAAAIAGGPVVLANGLTVEANEIAASLLQAQDRLFSSFEMSKTAAEADTYLKTVLAGLPETSPAAPSV